MKKEKRFVYEPVAGLTIIGAIKEAIKIAEERNEPITAFMNDVYLTITKKSNVERKKKEFQKKLKALYENKTDTRKEKFIYKPVEGLTVIGAIAEAIQVAEKRGETITAVVDNVRLTITKRSDSKKKLEEFYRKKILQRAKEKSR